MSVLSLDRLMLCILGVSWGYDLELFRAQWNGERGKPEIIQNCCTSQQGEEEDLVFKIC